MCNCNLFCASDFRLHVMKIESKNISSTIFDYSVTFYSILKLTAL